MYKMNSPDKEEFHCMVQNIQMHSFVFLETVMAQGRIGNR
jgi:hypothetical protein